MKGFQWKRDPAGSTCCPRPAKQCLVAGAAQAHRLELPAGVDSRPHVWPGGRLEGSGPYHPGWAKMVLPQRPPAALASAARARVLLSHHPFLLPFAPVTCPPSSLSGAAVLVRATQSPLLSPCTRTLRTRHPAGDPAASWVRLGARPPMALKPWSCARSRLAQNLPQLKCYAPSLLTLLN